MKIETDEFDEAMATEGKKIHLNVPTAYENCNNCQWNLTTEKHDKKRDMMCRDCSLAYTSNWTKKEYHGN